MQAPFIHATHPRRISGNGRREGGHSRSGQPSAFPATA